MKRQNEMESRLNLLCEAGVIDKDIRDGMLRVVTLLDEKWHLPVFSDQGAMAVTHMANALMRSRRGETIEKIDNDVFAELLQLPVWQQIMDIHEQLLSEFSVTLHPNEAGYMLANLYSLWGAAEEPGQV